MSVVLLLMVIAASLVIVNIAAVALELTGLPWEHARFQALSAFTNAGFTTRESEEIVGHPVRRRIASYLIVVGNAGLITTIGAFASSLMQERFVESLANIGLIMAGISLIIWIARRRGIGGRLKAAVGKRLAKRYGYHTVTTDELLHLGEGYTLTRVLLSEASPTVGKLLGDLDLERSVVEVLAIERGQRYIAVPRHSERLMAGDRVVVYGPDKAVENLFHPDPFERVVLVKHSTPSGPHTAANGA